MTFSLDMGTAPAVADVPQSVRRPTRWTQRPWFVNAVAVAFLLAVWQYLIIANARIPGLDEVIAFLAREVAGRSHGGMAAGEFWSPLGVSLQRYVAGLAIGLPLGAVLGVMIGASPRCRALLDDTVLVLLVLPSVIWAFSASLWFGFGSSAPIVAVVLAAAPFMAFNLRSGIGLIDTGLIEMSRSFRVPRMRRLMHLLVGGALPSGVAGLRLAFITGWNSLLIVEWFGATSGVGWRARFWYDALRYPGFAAWILLFVVFITLLDVFVLRRLERRALRWQQQPTLTFGEDVAA
ncbi:MAG: ABC transporter permease subunit [Acidimicrobiaceae bacterium]|nr:ABC transporter permease subunit [Acidimicrobiaceae bacterium]MDE0495817.1 ABC transporter permease subunit [Acidimicrobiaceae bacterium]